MKLIKKEIPLEEVVSPDGKIKPPYVIFEVSNLINADIIIFLNTEKKEYYRGFAYKGEFRPHQTLIQVFRIPIKTYKWE